jgi:long-chain acyl-CoA synthetase
MTHIFTIVACIFMPLLYKMTSVIVDTLQPRLLFRYIANLRVDYITAVPEIYGLLSRLKDHNEDLSSLKTLVSGGSLLTRDSYENIRNGLGIELCQGYGLTEFTPVSANRRYEARSGTVGPVCDQVACRIESASPEEGGEILIKTPDMMGAYYRRTQESREANQEGWFRTGDSGRFQDGHLVFIKELKKTRKINGNLVDLEEVSRAICMDTDIAEAQVGLEGNCLVAGICISKYIDLESKTKELRSYLRQNLAVYKIPKRITAL